MTHKAKQGGENKRALIATRITDTKLDPKHITEIHIMTTEIKADTKRAEQSKVIASQVSTIIKIAKGDDKTFDVAEVIYTAHKGIDAVYGGPATLIQNMRNSVKDAGYAPKSRTKEYFTLDNTIRSIANHYGRLAKWKKAKQDQAWDYETAAKRLVSAHTEEEVKAYLKAVHDELSASE